MYQGKVDMSLEIVVKEVENILV